MYKFITLTISSVMCVCMGVWLFWPFACSPFVSDEHDSTVDEELAHLSVWMWICGLRWDSLTYIQCVQLRLRLIYEIKISGSIKFLIRSNTYLQKVIQWLFVERLLDLNENTTQSNCKCKNISRLKGKKKLKVERHVISFNEIK